MTVKVTSLFFVLGLMAQASSTFFHPYDLRAAPYDLPEDISVALENIAKAGQGAKSLRENIAYFYEGVVTSYVPPLVQDIESNLILLSVNATALDNLRTKFSMEVTSTKHTIDLLLSEVDVLLLRMQVMTSDLQNDLPKVSDGLVILMATYQRMQGRFNGAYDDISISVLYLRTSTESLVNGMEGEIVELIISDLDYLYRMLNTYFESTSEVNYFFSRAYYNADDAIANVTSQLPLPFDP